MVYYQYSITIQDSRQTKWNLYNNLFATFPYDQNFDVDFNKNQLITIIVAPIVLFFVSLFISWRIINNILASLSQDFKVLI
jgi:hypothetical protein